MKVDIEQVETIPLGVQTVEEPDTSGLYNLLFGMMDERIKRLEVKIEHLEERVRGLEGGSDGDLI